MRPLMARHPAVMLQARCLGGKWRCMLAAISLLLLQCQLKWPWLAPCDLFWCLDPLLTGSLPMLNVSATFAAPIPETLGGQLFDGG